MFVNFFKYIKNFLKSKIMGKKKIKKYRVSPNESLCLAVSVVDKPAVESEFVYLSEQKQENFVAVEKKERRMIYGCALRCDFPIYRNNGKEEYYLEFDAEAIDKISKDFLKNGFQKNWTVGHEAEVENLSVCESWIKESTTLDKSIALGLDPDIPVGSWFLGCYCQNDEVWNDVKEGKYHGFSIEAIVGLEEFEKQMKDVDTETSEAGRITPKEDEIKLEEETSPTVETPNEATETPSEPSKVDEPITTPSEENKPSEEPKEEPTDNVKHLENLLENVRSEVEALKEINKELTSKIKQLEKEPSAKPVNVNGKPNAGDAYSAWRERMRQFVGY